MSEIIPGTNKMIFDAVKETEKRVYQMAINPYFDDLYLRTYAIASVTALVTLPALLAIVAWGAWRRPAIWVKGNSASLPIGDEGDGAMLATHDFIEQRWPEIRTQWPEPSLQFRAAAAMNMRRLPQMNPAIGKSMPEPIRNDLRRLAIETGIRYSAIGGLYDPGIKVLGRFAPRF